MPSSYVDSFPPIVKLLTDIAPKRVIDIGPGWGKYGLACREYLPNLEGLHAVEVRPGRLHTQDTIYDWVFTADARSLDKPAFWGRWDLALLIDVVEHMTQDEAHRLLAVILEGGTDALVSTPKQWHEQHVDANPYEAHVSHWRWEDFERYRIASDVSTIDSVIYHLVPT